jgi:hypothetical protein
MKLHSSLSPRRLFLGGHLLWWLLTIQRVACQNSTNTTPPTTTTNTTTDTNTNTNGTQTGGGSSGIICTVCADGAAVGNPDLIIPFLNIDDNQNPTCQQLSEFESDSTTSPNDVVCDRIQSNAHFCGCPETTGVAPPNVCTLCQEGATPANGDMATPLGDTCTELNTYLSFLPASSCNTPLVKRIQTTDFLCGCPGATAACPMCPDGTSAIATPDKPVPFLNLPELPNPTCQQVVDYGLLIDEEETFNCDNIVALAGYCGCATAINNTNTNDTTTVQNACPLCKDGTPVPNADALRFGVTCRQLEEYMSYQTTAQCATELGQSLSRMDSLCGCPNAAQPSCAMCPDGTSDIAHPDWVIPFFSIPNIKNPTCMDAVSFAAIQPDGYEQCNAFSVPAGYCGCANLVPSNACSLCPGGEAPLNLDMVIPDQTFTCNDLYTYIPFFSQALCDTNTVLGMQRLAYTCGCPSAQPECTLCIDGSMVPEPEKVFHEDGSTCGGLQETVSQLSGQVCQEQAVPLNLYAYRCGCPKDIVPQCQTQLEDTKGLCTLALISSTTEVCECYSFCEGILIGCDVFPGLPYTNCPGTAVIGCNLAGTVDYVAPTRPPTRAPMTMAPTSASATPMFHSTRTRWTILLVITTTVTTTVLWSGLMFLTL